MVQTLALGDYEMTYAMRAQPILLILLGLALASAVQADTEGSADLVSFSFDEPSGLNYEPPDFLEHVQDTVFSPNNNWFPSIRFIGGGQFSEIEVDALSYGHDADTNLFDAFFSVGRGSQGLPGTDVSNELPEDDRYSDIFASDKEGNNTQIYDGDGSSAEILGLLENASTNLDALDMRATTTKGLIYWSVSKETAETKNPYAAAGVSGADIFIGLEGNGYSIALPLNIYAQAWDLGLTGSDDVDAVVVIDIAADGVFDPNVDTIYFSLVDGSTSLAAAGIPPFLVAGPADIFMVGGLLATPIVAASAAKLGLQDTDELDALDLAIREDILIALPEPSSVWMLFFGSTLLVALDLHRRKSATEPMVSPRDSSITRRPARPRG